MVQSSKVPETKMSIDTTDGHKVHAILNEGSREYVIPGVDSVKNNH